MKIKRRLERLWYGHSLLSYGLWPSAVIFQAIIKLRRALYRLGVLTVKRAKVPVIVVGNITVGGCGKTPVVIALVDFLRAQGYSPGVVSRGYGGRVSHYPVLLNAQSSALDVGDEPLLIWQRTQVPVVVDPKRTRAVTYLSQNTHCDVIISDDGLQHYAMARDFEIAMLDAKQGLGNGMLLPAGPLRESASRLHSVDWVVVNGGDDDGLSVNVTVDSIRHCVSNRVIAVEQLKTKALHAVAGIASPDRFFDTLIAQGLQFTAHVFDDHYAFGEDDLAFADDAYIIMTEKDAVKCGDFATDNMFYLAISANLPQQLTNELLQGLTRKSGREQCLV